MKKHEADTTMNRHGWRDEPLEIEVGGLYEVWLQHDWEEPKPCVTVIPTSAGTNFKRWKVLVDGQVKDVYAGQIFKSGTATRPNPRITMPTIKNMPALLSINEIVSVQPMTMPVSSIFYMDYKLGEEKQ
jgi:hypothetical protein